MKAFVCIAVFIGYVRFDFLGGYRFTFLLGRYEKCFRDFVILSFVFLIVFRVLSWDMVLNFFGGLVFSRYFLSTLIGVLFIVAFLMVIN